MITLEDYFKGHAGNPEITGTMEANADELLNRVNILLEEAASGGVSLRKNPSTGTYVSGQRNGGFRPSNSTVGASKSKHREAKAVDIYDPNRELATWCINHADRLHENGLWMEDPRWTPTWTHLQAEPPRSQRLVFVPSSEPPLADPVEGQEGRIV